MHKYVADLGVAAVRMIAELLQQLTQPCAVFLARPRNAQFRVRRFQTAFVSAEQFRSILRNCRKAATADCMIRLLSSPRNAGRRLALVRRFAAQTADLGPPSWGTNSLR